jgi:hypothetical protein
VRLLAAALAGAILLCSCESRLPRQRAKIPPSTPGPVFILGFDGLDPKLIQDYEQQGLLPNFARLRSEGAVGNLRSTLPFLSPPAWTTVATGVPPSGHGIWSFWISSPMSGKGRYVDATCRLAPPLWEDLTRSGRTVGIINVPLTSPADSVNGFMVSGLPYPEAAPLTFPPDLEQKILSEGYVRDVLTGPPAPGKEEVWLDEVWRSARARREIGLDLLFDRRPDFSMIVFTHPDRIQHHLWRFHDPNHPLHQKDSSEKLQGAVREAYRWCDEVLGEVMDRMRQDQTLFVLSDHGFGAAYYGISKARALERLPESLRRRNPRGVSLFGGEFYLDESTRQEREELVRALESLTGDREAKLVRAAHDLITGAEQRPGAFLGPAVFAEEAEGYMFHPGSPGDSLVQVLDPRAFSGYHRRVGYFAAWGHPVRRGPVRDLDLQDVPAMTFHLLGEEIPRRWIHNIPRRLFPDAYFVERPMRFTGAPNEGFRAPNFQGDPAAEDSAGEIRRQLEALGYVQ